MIYFKKDTALPPFIPLPRFMIASEHSINAKLLYGLMLNRTMLSQKSGWVQFTELSGRCSVFERPLSDAKRPLIFN